MAAVSDIRRTQAGSNGNGVSARIDGDQQASLHQHPLAGVYAGEPVGAESERLDANLLNLLIVDDERVIRDGCREVAQQIGFNTFIADNADHALKVFEKTSIDVVLLDLRMPGCNGLDVLREVKKRRPDTVVVVITGYATVQSAVQAMKQGAYDYVTKPFNLDELKMLLERVVSHLHLTSENRILREQVKSKEGFGSIIGRSGEMEKLYRIIAKAAHSTHPVLILGESGSGKELVARSVHYSGPFRDKPFIPVDCSSLPSERMESELFGHVKGAFAGATKAKEGLIVMAEGGTIFLDEISELPIDLQSKLLRALQEREVHPVGGGKAQPINVRILAATNRDMELAVSQGAFRRDLYFRLNVLTLRIPPLRQRRQDIPLLVGHFMERLERATGQTKIISDEALKLLCAYDWPGNVRELENTIESACALSTSQTMHVSDLPSAIQNWRDQTQSEPPTVEPANKGIQTIADMEKQAILSAIDQLHGDKLEAARLLGIGKTTLYRKLKEYGALQ